MAADMQAHEEDYDVVVAGAGMVGAAVALGLHQAGFRVCVVEACRIDAEQAYSPSYDDRATAISWGSAGILSALGVWSAVGVHATPIAHVHVSEQGRFGTVQMHAEELDVPALGYVVPNQWLGNCLIRALRQSSVELRDQRRIVSVAQYRQGAHSGSRISLVLRHAERTEQVRAQVLVIVDGAPSTTAALLGIETQIEHYDQYALIANVSTELAHQNVAYERFTRGGPLAMLPLAGQQSALVWTLDPAAHAEMMALDPQAFCQCLQASFGERLGRITAVGERQSYPLRLTRIVEQSRPGVLVLGNAAHSLHPVAGQGFNLALRGVAAWLDFIFERKLSASQLGDGALLAAFCASLSLDQQRTIALSDRLVKTFGSDNMLMGLARDLGLLGLEAIPGLKSRFAHMAMGLVDRQPQFGEVRQGV